VVDLGRAYTRFHEVRGPIGDDTIGLIDSLRGLGSSVLDILQGGDEALSNCFEILKAVDGGKLDDFIFPLAEAPLIAPIPQPPLLIHFNTFEKQAKAEAIHHGASQSSPLPRAWYEYPLHYYGSPYNLIGDHASVIFPEGETLMDFECEIAAVLGEDVRDVSLEDAEDAILGYTLVNDWTARKIESGLISAFVGPSKAKTFCTGIGPAIVTKDELPDIAKARISARINGKEVAVGKLGDARFNFGEMVSYASEGTVLPAGTVICAGAINGGSCLERGEFLKAGDVVELSAEGIGTLTNKVWERQHPRSYAPKG
jgi:2-keto-4-pentenoate hydratase/2-oxohepta-3-ene-1,7-dioic acid hydratase in catechol pathway